MKINKIMEECRKLITPEIKRNVELSMYIADKIFDILESKNLTQRQLAERLGKSESEISSWLTGTHTFTTKTIAKIESALEENIFNTQRVAKPQIVVNVTGMYESSVNKTNGSWLSMNTQSINMRSFDANIPTRNTKYIS